MKIEDKRKKETKTIDFDDLNIGDVFEFEDKKVDNKICIKVDEFDEDRNYYSFSNICLDECNRRNEKVIKLDAVLTINKNDI